MRIGADASPRPKFRSTLYNEVEGFPFQRRANGGARASQAESGPRLNDWARVPHGLSARGSRGRTSTWLVDIDMRLAHVPLDRFGPLAAVFADDDFFRDL